MIATVHRPIGTGRLQVSMPFARDNRAWIHREVGSQIRPEWNTTTKRWEIARAHMRTVVEALAERYGVVEVTIDFRTTSRCDNRCRDAKHDDCDCQCLGENHRGAAYWRYWMEVGETTLIGVDIARRTFRVTAR